MSVIADHLNYIYSADTAYEHKALDDVSFKIEDGEYVALLGQTGSGKSTLAQHLNGLLKPSSGTVYVNGEDIFEKGYYAVQYDTFTGAYFSWSMKNNSDSDIEWSVYVSDTELSEEEIKELSKTKSLGVNEGSDAVSEGQWIIVICNINKETADAPVDSTFHLVSFRDYA